MYLKGIRPPPFHPSNTRAHFKSIFYQSKNCTAHHFPFVSLVQEKRKRDEGKQNRGKNVSEGRHIQKDLIAIFYKCAFQKLQPLINCTPCVQAQHYLNQYILYIIYLLYIVYCTWYIVHLVCTRNITSINIGGGNRPLHTYNIVLNKKQSRLERTLLIKLFSMHCTQYVEEELERTLLIKLFSMHCTQYVKEELERTLLIKLFSMHCTQYVEEEKRLARSYGYGAGFD